MLGVADWIDGSADKPPPDLTLYLNIKNWGDPWGDGWMKWPAGLISRLRLARNVYNAWSGYSKSDNRAKWLNEHPDAREIVGNVKSFRYEEEDEEKGRVERWEEWLGIADMTDLE